MLTLRRELAAPRPRAPCWPPPPACPPPRPPATLLAAASAAATGLGGEVVVETHLHIVLTREVRRRAVIVARRAVQRRRGVVLQQGQRLRAETLQRNLITRKRLAGRRVDERRGDRRKVAGTHGVGRHRRVLIERVCSGAARIRDRHRRPVVGVLVDARELDRELCREVIVVIRVPGFDTADLRAQLLRGAVQRGTGERVGGSPLNPLTLAEVLVAPASARASATALVAATPRRPWKSPPRPWKLGFPTGSPLKIRIAFEPAREVARIEVGPLEVGATPIVEQPAIDACRFTSHGKRVGQRFGAEAERRQGRGIRLAPTRTRWDPENGCARSR